jgi:acyl-CoA thioesterase
MSACERVECHNIRPGDTIALTIVNCYEHAKVLRSWTHLFVESDDKLRYVSHRPASHRSVTDDEVCIGTVLASIPNAVFKMLHVVKVLKGCIFYRRSITIPTGAFVYISNFANTFSLERLADTGPLQ